MRKLSKTKAEKAHENWLIAKEAVAIWLVRWSQVMFWVGFFLVLGEMALIITDALIDIFTISEMHKLVLYCIGTAGAVLFVFGTNVYFLMIEPCAKREKRRGTDE